MISCFILLLYAHTIGAIGYDAGGGDRATCGRPYRAGRLYQPPCDIRRMGYCLQAGQLYPWRAVKRFVKDNQGLMRRMYGDQRQGHVLRTELDDEDFEEEWEKNERERGGYGRWRPEPMRFARYQHYNEIDRDEETDFAYNNPYTDESRFLRGDLTNKDVLNTKFVISEKEAAISIKLAKIKATAHFRPATSRSTIPTQRTTASTSKTPDPPTTTQKSSTAVTTKVSTSIKSKKEATTINAPNDVILTDKMGSTSNKNVTKNTLADVSTQASTLNTTLIITTENFINEYTTDTTTYRTTESVMNDTTTEKPASRKKNTVGNPSPENTTTAKSTTVKNAVIDQLEDAVKNEVSVKIEENHQNSITIDNLKNIEDNPQDNDEHLNDSNPDKNLDQTVESSEHSEVYSENNGNIKQVEIGNTPAMLFQDMEEEVFKKRVPVDFNKMKGINACPVKEEVVAPFWANNTRGEVLALLNMYPFEQYVHWEKCTFEHRQMYCREGCRCEQQYRLHRLLAYDPKNECRGIFSDWFRFPSCCVCKCYDMPAEFRVTSRSPRFFVSFPEKEEEYET